MKCVDVLLEEPWRVKDVVIVERFEKALEQLRDQSFDLALLDDELKEFDLCEALRAKIPVVILSLDPSRERLVLGAGAAAFVANRPGGELQARLRSALAKIAAFSP